MSTIREDSDPAAAVHFAIMGGRFRLRRRDDGLGCEVLDDDDNVIGTANNLIYGSRGYAVHTRPFAGFVSIDQIDFV